MRKRQMSHSMVSHSTLNQLNFKVKDGEIRHEALKDPIQIDDLGITIIKGKFDLRDGVYKIHRVGFSDRLISYKEKKCLIIYGVITWVEPIDKLLMNWIIGERIGDN